MGTNSTTAKLVEYGTAKILRDATAEELSASVEAAKVDGGAGVIEVDGRRCYVEGDEVAS